MRINSQLLKKLNLARLGFRVVPTFLMHPEYGMVELHADGDGMRVIDGQGNIKHQATWDEIENTDVSALRIDSLSK